jgi:hypothetical protein
MKRNLLTSLALLTVTRTRHPLRIFYFLTLDVNRCPPNVRYSLIGEETSANCNEGIILKARR